MKPDSYIEPEPQKTFNKVNFPINESLNSLKEVTNEDPYPNLPRIPFNVAATLVITGLIIQTYCVYHQEPVGWGPIIRPWQLLSIFWPF
jgi:hypothetical protein